MTPQTRDGRPVPYESVKPLSFRQEPRPLAARSFLYDNLTRLGIDAEEVVLGRIERDMDKYFRAFNLIGVNDLL